MRPISLSNLFEIAICREISTSQQDFFKMLEEKIENVSIILLKNEDITGVVFLINKSLLASNKDGSNRHYIIAS